MADRMTNGEQSPAAAPASAADDFDLALQEFAAANPPASKDGNGSGVADPPNPAPDPKQQIEETREQLDAVRQLGELRQWAHGVQDERLERSEREESESMFAKGREMIADLDSLPGDFAERWLRAEYSIDPELHHAWDNRHESPDAMRQCQSAVRRAMDRLRDAARKMPDAEATSTRAAVNASVLRHASRERPPAAAPNYSNMTDGEFRDAVKKEHGYTPL